jgi:hypothetical protein
MYYNHYLLVYSSPLIKEINLPNKELFEFLSNPFSYISLNKPPLKFFNGILTDFLKKIKD